MHRLQLCLLSNRNVRHIDAVALIRCCLNGEVLQRCSVYIRWSFTVATNHFFAYLDSNQPSVVLCVTGNFDAICLHISSMAD